MGTSVAGLISGGDRFALEMLAALAEDRRDAVRVMVSASGAETIKRFAYKDLLSIIADKDPRPTDTWGLRYVHRCIAAVRASFRLEVADVVFSTSSYFFDIVPALSLYLRSREAKFVTTAFHLVPPPWARSGNAIINTLAWLEQRASICLAALTGATFVTDNSDVVRSLSERGIRSDKLILARMGVKAKAGPLRYNTGSRTAIYVGRFSAVKGVPALLDAWEVLASRVRTAPPRLILVGSDAPGFCVDREIAQRRLGESVEVRRGLDDSAVTELVRAAAIFVTASKEEGYGLSILEAFACGVPAVTFDLPAFRLAFPRGRAVASDFSPVSFADAVEWVVDDPKNMKCLQEEVAALDVEEWRTVAKGFWEAIGVLK